MNWKTTGCVVAAVLMVILLCVFRVQGAQNHAITLEEAVTTAQSDIDTQIDRKVNVLTELAECVKQYDAYEGQTLENIIAKRNPMDIDSSQIITEVTAVAEAYPELQSQENYKSLMAEISTTENLLQRYKETYNETIKDYNRYVRKFPTRCYLNLTGYEVHEFQKYSTSNVDQPMELFN